jgi:hypothetical protein
LGQGPIEKRSFPTMVVSLLNELMDASDPVDQKMIRRIEYVLQNTICTLNPGGMDLEQM